MAILRLTYPVIRFHQLDVEVTDEQAEEIENMCQEDKARFIIQQNECRQTLEMVVDQKNMEAALDVDYATIKHINHATHSIAE